MYKVGDSITITQEMVAKWKHDFSSDVWSRDMDAWLGKKGVCQAKRLGRADGQMIIDWGEEKTNVYWLENIGLEFEKLEFSELPIMECPEEFLTDRELVIKTLMKRGDTEAAATAKVDEVASAMDENEMVFYRP